MKPRFLLTFFVAILLLAGCSGPTAPAAEVPVSQAPAAEAVALELGPTVDVETVAAVKYRDDVLVIDVREQHEYDAGHIPGVTLIPMGTVPARLDEIPTDKEVIVTCRSGNRSGQVTDFLREQGFENVHNMAGGILDWEASGYEVER